MNEWDKLPIELQLYILQFNSRFIWKRNKSTTAIKKPSVRKNNLVT